MSADFWLFVFIGLTGGGMLGFGLGGFLKSTLQALHQKITSPQSLRAKASPLARSVVDLLREDPAGWSESGLGLTITHAATGVTFWVSQETWVQPCTLPLRNFDVLKGEGEWKHTYARPSPSQRYVFAAYQEWKNPTTKLSKDSEAMIGAILTHLNTKVRPAHDGDDPDLSPDAAEE